MFFMMLSDSSDVHKAEELYSTYKNVMYHTAYAILEDKTLSEDVVHETMVRIIKHFEKIKEINSPMTYRFLVIISRNIALNIYNKRKKEVYTDDIEEFETGTDFMLPEKLVIDRESYNEISGLIQSLPENLSVVIFLKYTHDCTNKEISELLNLSEDNVRQRLHRAKLILKKIYGGVKNAQ